MPVHSEIDYLIGLQPRHIERPTSLLFKVHGDRRSMARVPDAPVPRYLSKFVFRDLAVRFHLPCVGDGSPFIRILMNKNLSCVARLLSSIVISLIKFHSFSELTIAISRGCCASFALFKFHIEISIHRSFADQFFYFQLRSGSGGPARQWSQHHSDSRFGT
jgi:hypothetical protein